MDMQLLFESSAIIGWKVCCSIHSLKKCKSTWKLPVIKWDKPNQAHILFQVCNYKHIHLQQFEMIVVHWLSALFYAQSALNDDEIFPWASYQIRKIAGWACAGNAGNIFPTTYFKGNC